MPSEDAASGTIETVITFLEMRAAPRSPRLTPPAGKLAFLRAEKPTLSYYRYLYNTVGEPWLWYERRALDDAALAATVHDPMVEIYVLYVDGVPAGFAELDRREAPEIELAYFGLIPEFIGRGLGKHLLHWAIEAAWSHAPERLWVHSCTLDHPKALAIYQRAGFLAYRQETKVFDDPRRTGLMPPEAGQGIGEPGPSEPPPGGAPPREV